jgi:hypothetical protein
MHGDHFKTPVLPSAVNDPVGEEIGADYSKMNFFHTVIV